jgi:hypothetical protein
VQLGTRMGPPPGPEPGQAVWETTAFRLRSSGYAIWEGMGDGIHPDLEATRFATVAESSTWETIDESPKDFA